MRFRSIALGISLSLAFGALLVRAASPTTSQAAKTAALDAQALSRQL